MNEVQKTKKFVCNDNIQYSPLVSIIVSGYNIEKYINKCLESVINQTYKNIEIILIDDGSSDNTTSIMKKYTDNDVRIKFFPFKTNSCGGIGTPGNFGIDKAHGEYIVFCDGDDWLSLTAVEDLLSVMLKEEPDFVYANNMRFDDSTNAIIPHYDSHLWDALAKTNSLYERKKLLFIMGVEPWKKMYASQFIRSKNIRFPVGDFFYEDMPFHIQCVVMAEKISIINKTTYFYRINRTGATSTKANNARLKVYTHLFMLLQWMQKENLFVHYRDVFLLQALRTIGFIADGLDMHGLVQFNKLSRTFYKNFSIEEIKRSTQGHHHNFKAIHLALAARESRFFLVCLILLCSRIVKRMRAIFQKQA